MQSSIQKLMKYRIFISQLPDENSLTTLSAEEANHITNVLRLKDGVYLEAFNGKGQRQKVQLTLQSRYVQVKYAGPIIQDTFSGNQTVFAIGILKNAAMSTVIQKSSELGIHTIYPLLCERTVVKPTHNTIKRWNTIAEQSLKQCGRTHALVIKPIQTVDSFLNTFSEKKIWCNEHAKAQGLYITNYLITNGNLLNTAGFIIGPEGGFSSKEIALLEKTCQPISLGSYILRADTAALFTMSITQGLQQLINNNDHAFQRFNHEIK